MWVKTSMKIELAYACPQNQNGAPLGKSSIPFPVFLSFPEPCTTVNEGPPCRFFDERFSPFSCSDILSAGEPVCLRITFNRRKDLSGASPELSVDVFDGALEAVRGGGDPPPPST